MKIISLNTWGGRGGVENLLAFFKKHQDVDVFCLQEIWNGGEDMLGQQAGGMELMGVSTTLLSDIAKILPNHESFFRPHFSDYYGLGMFVKKTLPVTEEGEVYVYKEPGYVSDQDKGNHARNMQYVGLALRTPLAVLNIHGLWNGKGKTDTEDRLTQSDNIATFINTLKTPHIIMGDFNLRPDTQSVAKLEQCGLRNLITEYGVTSTRTSMYTKEEKFADYAFVSDGVTVKDFQVLPDEVSDHAALYLEVE